MTVQRTTYVYSEVSLRAEFSGVCPECGKCFRRQKTFSETLNPWNRNPDGSPKNRQQIVESLRAKRVAWKPRHKTCEER